MYLTFRINNNITDDIAKDAEKIADIEIASIVKTWQLYNWVTPDPYAMPAGIYNPFTVSDAIRRWPNINWPMMLILLAKDNTDLLHVFGYPFVITNPQYVDFINEMFANEDPRAMQNFLLWKLVELEIMMMPSMRCE